MLGQTPEKGPGKHRKMLDPGEYRKKKKKYNPSECRKGGIWASTRNVGSGRVPEMWDLGEYQKCGIWASTRNVGSGRVPEMWELGEYQKCRIRASTGNVGSGRVPER